jgi:soluble lytic murein transglycosylase-like protein
MISLRHIYLTAIVLFIASASDTVSADIYRFKDENGVWHFSNINNDSRYRLYLRYHNNPKLYISDYSSAIQEASEKYGVDTSLIKAVIHAESAFDPSATSSNGAKGLMQLMPYTAEDLAVNVDDPTENIFGGTKYLSMMIKRFNKIEHALAAYNAGPENVETYNGVPPFEETKTFIRRVLDYYKQYKSQAR